MILGDNPAGHGFEEGRRVKKFRKNICQGGFGNFNFGGGGESRNFEVKTKTT